MNMNSLNTPAMDESISKLLEDTMACHRLENYQMIFSASVLTKLTTMRPPKLQDYGATNGSKLFLVS